MPRSPDGITVRHSHTLCMEIKVEKPSWKQFRQHARRAFKQVGPWPLKCILGICSSELITDIYKELSESDVRMLITLI